jgi:hypothetical protein
VQLLLPGYDPTALLPVTVVVQVGAVLTTEEFCPFTNPL